MPAGPQGDVLAELLARRPTRTLDVALPQDRVEEFHAQGFTSIERITTDEELAWLGDLYDWLFAERVQAVPGGYFDLSRPYDSPGEDLQPQLLAPEARIPQLRETALFRNGRRLAAELLGVDASAVHGWGHMIRKPPRVGAPLPWHQDEAYWDPAFDYRALGVWMPLDPATPESGCMSFLPGSHRGDVRAHRHVGDDPRVHALVTDEVDARCAVAVPLAPGGASFHHCRTLHSSGPNRSPHPRRAYANEFQTRPVRRATPFERPWIEAGRRAWEAREPARRARSPRGE
jgi:hypothetical protein